KLARLRLTDEQLDTFTSQLAAVLDHAADVEALELDDVPPTAHPFPLANIMRPDVARDAGVRDAVLAEAPSTEDGMFRVPSAPGSAAPARSSRSTSPRSRPATPSSTPSTTSPARRHWPRPTPSTPGSPPARTRDRWPASRWRSRTTSAPRASPPPARPRSSR